MEEHRLAVPLCALEVASSDLPPAAASCPPAAGRRSTLVQPLLGKHHSVVAAAEACSDALNSELPTPAVAASCLPLASAVETKGEAGQRSAATSSAVTRRNSSFGPAEGNVTSTSPDGSYISSPFFTGSPMDFPETLQPRAINIASDVQCSLSTPLEKFFDVLDSTDTPVATPSPLATVCTHHTTSAAADAFPLNGALAQDAEVPQEAGKSRVVEHGTRVTSPENFSSSSAFPIRAADATVHKHVKEQQTRSFPSSRRSSSHDGTSRTTTCGEGSDAGLLETRGLSAFPCGKGEEVALDTEASSGVTRGSFPQDKPMGADEVATSDADRLLVDFQLLLILLFDQVCNVVPGLRRQDGGAFYSLHLQRIAAGPLHPTLASYADVLLPICSAMNFFSEDKNTEPRAQKPDENDSILSVALRYLARHGTIPAAPIADTVAKCPAAVFIQVVSALECMYSLQRMLAPGSSEHRERVSAELDPKTIWGDAVMEMEKAAGVLAEECVADSVLPRGPHEEEGPSSSQLLPPPPSVDHSSRPPKRPRSLSECASSRKQVASAGAAAKHDAEPENRGALASPPLNSNLSTMELNGSAASVTPSVSLPAGAMDCGLLPSTQGEGSPAFISASVNKRRHPNVQAEILNSCCPERLAQRGTRLLGEVLQKLQSEQALRPSCTKSHSPKQPVGMPLHEPAEAAPRQQEGGCGVLLPGRDCDSLSGGSARGKRKPPAAGEHTLGEALATLSTPQHAGAAGCCPTPSDLETMQADGPADSQLKRHGYGLRKGAAKKGRRPAEEAAAARAPPRLTPVKTQHPQQMRVKAAAAAAALPSGETTQQDPSASLPPNLTEQLMKLAKGADGDFPAALSSTMRGVFFNRSLNRWVCTWSRNGKEYQRSWSAGKYGYETARGLAMHCRLEKLLSGEAHTLQKGMLAVFKPVINSQVSPASADSTVASCGRQDPVSPEETERRKPDVQKLRSSPRPTLKGENTAACREADSQLSTKKTDHSTETSAAAAVAPRPQSSSTYSDMLTLMSQAISRNPEAFSFEGEGTEAAAKNDGLRDKDGIKELGDPSVGEHFLAAVAAAAAVCDVPGFED
ncbi:hypothetical protein Emed_003535 [Eimeria media]